MRGGKRPGAGRKPGSDEKRGAIVALRVKQETKDAMPLLRAKGINPAREFEKLVDKLKGED